jgi:hypothetical protein
LIPKLGLLIELPEQGLHVDALCEPVKVSH